MGQHQEIGGWGSDGLAIADCGCRHSAPPPPHPPAKREERGGVPLHGALATALHQHNVTDERLPIHVQRRICHHRFHHQFITQRSQVQVQ
jgi:hypothetical protein